MEVAKSKITEDEQYRRAPAAVRFSLVELVVFMFFAAIAFTLASQGVALLGATLFLTVLAFRTSCVDFSVIGAVSVLGTVVFGTFTLAMLVFWTAGW